MLNLVAEDNIFEIFKFPRLKPEAFITPIAYLPLIHHYSKSLPSSNHPDQTQTSNSHLSHFGKT
jgi:hypothetical protein